MSSAYSPLPRSPSSSPRRLSVQSILPPVVTSPTPRRRPIALVVVSLFCVVVFLSVSPLSQSLAPDLYLRITGRLVARPFRKEGLSRPLYSQLSKIDHRSFVLRPVEHDFVRDRSQLDEVPWTTDDLLPRRKTAGWNWVSRLLPLGRAPEDEYARVGMIRGTTRDPLPVHTIDTFPRKVDLTRGQGGVGQEVTSLDRIMFGSVTTTKRAHEMTTLWSEWMKPRHGDQAPPACLILLSADETEDDIEALKKTLSDRKLPCVLKQSQHERYEVRVMSMIKEMQDYSDSLECVPVSAFPPRNSALTGTVELCSRSFDWFVFGDE